MLDLLVARSVANPDIFALCSLLMQPVANRKKKWKEAVALVDSLLVKVEAESIRRGIVTNLSNKLTQSSNEEAADDYANLIMHFSKNTFYTGKGMLIAMVLQACNL
jgi:hypothetical protein